MSRIVKLEVSNFKRVRAVEIEPSGALVQIRGRNGAGKSSCLDAIAAALGGEKLAPKEPVRRGAENAVVRIELDDGLIVERRWTAAGGSSLKLTSKEGLRYDKPQKRLDDLIGRLSFDPLAFLRLPAREQAETLRKLSGVDFSLLDGQRRAAYDDRAAANRQVAQLTARLSAMPSVEAPDELVSAADLLADQEKRRARHEENEAKRRDLQRFREGFKAHVLDADEAARQIARLKDELAKAEKEHAALRAKADEVRAAGLALKAEVEALQDPDMEEIPARLREVEVTNERVRQKKARAALVQDLEQAELEAKELDDDITAIDQQKAAALAAAKLPVAGLAFADDGVTLNGLPLQQAATSEQLRLSVAIGAAANSAFRALLVREGSLLDDVSMRLLADMASEMNLQLWVEVVSSDGEGGVLIEDGQVEAAAQPKLKEASDGR